MFVCKGLCIVLACSKHVDVGGEAPDVNNFTDAAIFQWRNTVTQKERRAYWPTQQLNIALVGAPHQHEVPPSDRQSILIGRWKQANALKMHQKFNLSKVELMQSLKIGGQK